MMDSFESMKDLADDAISYERSMAHVRYDHDKVVLARALLIERARTAKLRQEREGARRLAETMARTLDYNGEFFPELPWAPGIRWDDKEVDDA